MKIAVIQKIPTGEILRVRGLGGSGKARKYLAGRVQMRCKPYVPMQSGHLKNKAQISADGRQLIYEMPYAHYQYRGLVMAGRKPKHYTGGKIENHVGGPEWDKRMLIDHRTDLEKDVAAYIGRARK